MTILNPWGKRLCVFLPLYFFAFLPLSSQTFTQKVQQSKQGEGTVTIHHDAAIDELVNAQPAVKPTQPTHPNPTTPKKEKEDKPNNTSHQRTDTTEQPNKPVQNVDTLVMTGKTYKTNGYRVQVFAGGNTRRDKQKAEQIGRSMKQLFPNEAVYAHFYSPRWICRVGNYRTLEEANAKMMEIRQLGYNSATVVRTTIIVTQ